ncbi:MAG: hypothetical protein HF314_04330 [Ignavibacteria bacterium]|nr:hypothetical protein [Ignavibacteria bacterium]MCU7502277.1 hypothetical protein [Ignavibacteria bacterium]MCU7516679.1 hypothetical protein [Ignavibacteria bacterium]
MNPGARQIALSNSDAALRGDVFSAFNNPAGLSGLRDRELGVFYSPSPFGLKELSNAAAAYTEPLPLGTLSLGASTFGFSLYRKNNFLLAYALEILDFSLGLSLNLHNLTIKNYGSANSLTLNPGILIPILRELSWGLSVQNILNASIGKESGQIPRVVFTGFSYQPHRTVILNAAIEKSSGSPVSFRTGIEYAIIKYFSLRIGLSTEPDRFSAGAGINYSFLKFDYAVFTHQDLGLTHQIGTVLSFNAND